MSRTRRNETNSNEKRNKRRRNATEKLPREYANRDIIIGKDDKPFTAKINKLKYSSGQLALIESINNHDVVLVNGYAGTGKTTIAFEAALRAIINGTKKRIIYTKPIVPVGDSLGFLPKGVDDKIKPFVEFIYDVLVKLLPPEKIIELKQKEIIKHEPLQFIRGKTFEDSFIIFDEVQNAAYGDIEALTTRIGINSKIILAGSDHQIDLPTLRGRGTGFFELIETLELWKELIPETIHIDYVKLGVEDFHRHPMQKEYMKIREIYNQKKRSDYFSVDSNSFNFSTA